MKRGLIASYIAGITDLSVGERYTTILRYFFPEYLTSLMIFSLPFILDSVFVGHLESMPSYATLGITNNLMHLFIKLAEAFSIGTVILAGQYNGLGQFGQVGKVVYYSFWTNCIIGFLISLFLYLGAGFIYYLYGVPAEIAQLGIPFLKLRAISVFFMFLSYCLIGFLKGIKNTRTPMHIYLIGSLVFVFFDYGLIFGKLGLPAMGLNGSAAASIIQNIVMLITTIILIARDHQYKKYSLKLLSFLRQSVYIKELFTLIWPVIIDKATLAAAYIWLNMRLCHMGTCAVASFAAVKDMERFAFLPAIAFAQIITFLVSNDYGIHNWAGIKANIKKVIFLSSILVFSILVLFSLFTGTFIQFFDKKGEFSPMTIKVFPILSVLVFFDLLQLILSGALRGASNVKTVMWVRLIICGGYFVPVSYVLSKLPLENAALKFILIYGSFYIGNALMSLVYISRFRGNQWKAQSVLEDTYG
jgi:MATE family multidrug resistance protein